MVTRIVNIDLRQDVAPDHVVRSEILWLPRSNKLVLCTPYLPCVVCRFGIHPANGENIVGWNIQRIPKVGPRRHATVYECALIQVKTFCARHVSFCNNYFKMTDSVISIRSAEMEVGVPAFQPSVESTPSNVYVQEVKAQTGDENRISWVWRSPSSGLVCSPLAFGRFRLKIKSTAHKLSETELVGVLVGAMSTIGKDAVNAYQATTGMSAGALREGQKYRSLLCFGEGNCVQNATESISVSINGSTWTELNGNLYSRSLSRCFEPLDVQQKAYSTCGGSCLAFDDKPLSGHVVGLPDSIDSTGNAVTCTSNQLAGCGFRVIEGLTVDSSLAQRQQNLADQIVESSMTNSHQAGGSSEITVEIRFPISGGPFNSLWGASGLSRRDPRLRMALGIPNLNQGAITYTFKNLRKVIIRRLGRPTTASNNVSYITGAADVRATGAEDITVTFDTSASATPVLELTYLRLPSFRSYPQSSALAIYRRDCRRADGAEHGSQSFAAALFDKSVTSDQRGLRCAAGVASDPSMYTVCPRQESIVGAAHTYDAKWTGVMFPQVPNAIFIVMQKSSDVYNLGNPAKGIDGIAAGFVTGAATNQFDTNANAAASMLTKANANATRVEAWAQYMANRYIAQNQASNAAILQLEIVVQSAIGSFAFKSSAYPYLQDRDLLWRRHSQNCNDQYMKAGRGAWQKRASCALLSCSDFLLGLSTGPGCVFPIILDVKAKFANRAAVSSGACFTNGMAQGKYTFEDILVGEPVLVGCFDQQILSIASSSAVLSAQAFSASTYASAVSQG